MKTVAWIECAGHTSKITLDLSFTKLYLQTSSVDVDDKDKMLGKIEVAAKSNTKEKVQSMQLDSLH